MEDTDQTTAANTVEIEVRSTLKVTAAVINGEQARKATMMAKSDNDIPTALALYSIRKIERNGAAEAFAEPKNTGDLARVATRFTSGELGVFVGLLNEATTDTELEEKAKKLGERFQLG